MKYILLLLLSSILFVSCSNMDPAHYDTPKTPKAQVLKAEDYPLNKWRWDHETDVTHYFTNHDGSQTVVHEYNVHRYNPEGPQFVGWERSYEKLGYDLPVKDVWKADNTGFEARNDVELYPWAIIHHEGKRKAKTDTLNVVCNEYGFEALKDVELYSFWK